MSGKGFDQHIDNAMSDLGQVTQITGDHQADGLSFGIVVSRFNDDLTGQLLASAVKALTQHGAAEKDIEVVWVPGAYEASFIIKQMAERGGYAALIALGAVVDGDTRHAELITKSATQTLSDISRQFNVPVIDGITTAYTYEQAESRCREGETSRGWYCAMAAIEMARVTANYLEGTS